MLSEKDLPLEFKISGLSSDQISLENRQMIQKLFKNQISDDLDSVVLKGKEEITNEKSSVYIFNNIDVFIVCHEE